MDLQFGAVVLLTEDLEAATRFYQGALGLSKARAGADLSAFEFRGGGRLALLRRDVATALTGRVFGELPDLPAHLLSLQAGSADDVRDLIEAVRTAGGRIIKEPGHDDWAGYSATFADLDGNAWEISYNVEFYKK